MTNSERVMRFNHILFKEPGAESYRHLLVASNLVVPPSGSWTSHVSLAVVVSRGRSVGGAPVDDSPARMCGNNKPCIWKFSQRQLFGAGYALLNNSREFDAERDKVVLTDNPGNPTEERQQNV